MIGCPMSPAFGDMGTFQPRTETRSSVRAIHLGDNSLTAITTAGISITVEFSTHISDPAAT